MGYGKFCTAFRSLCSLQSFVFILSIAGLQNKPNVSQNKSLSDAFDPVLSLQGIGWLTRKALGAATITQHLYQSPTTGEDKGRSRYSTMAKTVEEGKSGGAKEEDIKFLAEGWLKETEDGDIVESYVDNEGNAWTAWQIWGFADIGGERKLTRKFVVRKKNKDEVVRVRLVYDYIGALESE